MRLARRDLLAGASVTAVGLLLPQARGAEVVAPLPLRMHVAALRVGTTSKAEPVVPAAFVDAQLAAANELFTAHGLAFAESSPRAELAEVHARLVTRADRDALAVRVARGAIDVFLVASLRDVDDPTRDRMGVTWRKLTDLSKKYVIVSAAAGPTTLAHELGHYLGLGHTSVRNNLMSYDRDGGAVFLDPQQGATVRRTARVLRARGELSS
jgi:hypothetical protein